MKDQLVLRIKHGDEQAFELLFRKYYVSMGGFASKFLMSLIFDASTIIT